MMSLVNLQMKPAGFMWGDQIGKILPTARPVLQCFFYELTHRAIGLELRSKVESRLTTTSRASGSSKTFCQQ